MNCLSLESMPRLEASGQVHFRGDLATVASANLHLCTADRVRICVARFAAEDFDTLFDTVRGIDWKDWIPLHGAFPVTGRSLKSQLSSVPAIQRTVKKAIVTALQRQHGTQELSESGESYPIEIALAKQRSSGDARHHWSQSPQTWLSNA